MIRPPAPSGKMPDVTRHPAVTTRLDCVHPLVARTDARSEDDPVERACIGAISAPRPRERA